MIASVQKPSFGIFPNPAHPSSRGLIGCWLLNEHSGPIAADISGNQQHGALSSGLSWTARGLNGFGEATIRYIDAGGDPITRPPNAFTVEIVCKTRSNVAAPNYQIFVTNNFPNVGMWLGTYLGTLRLYWGTSNKGDFGSVSVSTSTWYHVVFVIKENDFSHVYINGVFAGASGAVASFGWTGNEHFAIGHDSLWNNQAIFTECERVRYWNRALTAGEIANLYYYPYDMFEEDECFLGDGSSSGDIIGTHTAFSIAVTKGTHTGVVDIISSHTSESLAVTKGTHTGIVDVIGIHTAKSLAATKGIHTGVVDSQGIHIAESIAVTKGTHIGVVDIIGVHTAYSLELTKGTHVGEVGGNIIGIHSSFSIAITKGSHTGPVDIIGEHTGFSIAVTKGTHIGSVTINGNHTTKSIAVTKGTHTGIIDIIGIHTVFSLALNLGIHAGIVSSAVGYYNKSKTHVGIDVGV